MGHRRARGRAMGIAAMTPWAGLGAALLLGGCSSVGTAVGAVAGLASGASTANPVVGTAVGLGTKAAVDELVIYVGRVRQNAEQDAIAEAAGRLPVGGTARWENPAHNSDRRRARDAARRPRHLEPACAVPGDRLHRDRRQGAFPLRHD